MTDKHTWLSLVYMVLQMPLGILYFTLNVTLIAVSLSLIAAPFAQVFWRLPIISMDEQRIFLPAWELPLLAIGGFLLLTLGMHLARGIGWLHGKYAKWMLVSE